jgi:Uma2 family endonuclease
VAETSFAYDRNEKLPRYAEAGIPEVWLVDLAGETIIQSANPQGRRYTTTTQVKQGQMIQSTSLPQLQIEAAEILG